MAMAIPGLAGMPGTLITPTMVDITATIQATTIPLTGLRTIPSIDPLMSADLSLDRTGLHKEKDRFLMSIAHDKIHVTYQTRTFNDWDRTLIQDRKTWPVMQGRPRQEWKRIGREWGRFQIDKRAGMIVDNQKTTSFPTGMETSIVGLRRVGSSEPREVGSDLKKRSKDPKILSSTVRV